MGGREIQKGGTTRFHHEKKGEKQRNRVRKGSGKRGGHRADGQKIEGEKN